MTRPFICPCPQCNGTAEPDYPDDETLAQEDQQYDTLEERDADREEVDFDEI